MRESFQPNGNLLWVGVRTNLVPLVAWVRSHSLARPLDVVTNLEDPERLVERGGPRVPEHAPTSEFTSGALKSRIRMTMNALAAIDIKGADFRSRHKPPAKAIDFIASGLPLAMNDGKQSRRAPGADGVRGRQSA